MTAINRNGLQILFTFERDNAILTIYSKVTNSMPYPISNFIFKAAVPKVKEDIYLLILIRYENFVLFF